MFYTLIRKEQKCFQDLQYYFLQNEIQNYKFGP